MKLTFRGTFSARTDEKGRTAIPARFRASLKEYGDERLVLTRDLARRCVVVYPLAAWEAFEEKVLAKPQTHPLVVHVRTHSVAFATEQVPDTHGRVSLKDGLRSYADIDLQADVAFVGQIDRFEIWNETAWQQAEMTSAETRHEWTPDLADMGF